MERASDRGPNRSYEIAARLLLSCFCYRHDTSASLNVYISWVWRRWNTECERGCLGIAESLQGARTKVADCDKPLEPSWESRPLPCKLFQTMAGPQGSPGFSLPKRGEQARRRRRRGRDWDRRRARLTRAKRASPEKMVSADLTGRSPALKSACMMSAKTIVWRLGRMERFSGVRVCGQDLSPCGSMCTVVEKEDAVFRIHNSLPPPRAPCGLRHPCGVMHTTQATGEVMSKRHVSSFTTLAGRKLVDPPSPLAVDTNGAHIPRCITPLRTELLMIDERGH